MVVAITAAATACKNPAIGFYKEQSPHWRQDFVAKSMSQQVIDSQPSAYRQVNA